MRSTRSAFGASCSTRRSFAPSDAPPALATLAALSTGNPRVVGVGEVDRHRLYRLESVTPVRTDWTPLVAGATRALPDVQRIPPGATSVDLLFSNPGPASYRHPDPIVPSAVVLQWADATGSHVADVPGRVLLPLALAPDDHATRTVETMAPVAPGSYRVRLARTDAPADVLAVARVEIGDPPPSHAP